MINERYRIAFSETLHYLKGIDEDDINKIPKNFIQFMKEHSSKNYISNFDYNKPLNELELKSETYGIISMICLYWWCESPEQKEIFKKHLIENDKKMHLELLKSNDYNDIFKNNVIRIDTQTPNNEVNLVNYKVSFFNKILNKIFNFFKK